MLKTLTLGMIAGVLALSSAAAQAQGTQGHRGNGGVGRVVHNAGEGAAGG